MKRLKLVLLLASNSAFALPIRVTNGPDAQQAFDEFRAAKVAVSMNGTIRVTQVVCQHSIKNSKRLEGLTCSFMDKIGKKYIKVEPEACFRDPDCMSDRRPPPAERIRQAVLNIGWPDHPPFDFRRPVRIAELVSCTKGQTKSGLDMTCQVVQ